MAEKKLTQAQLLELLSPPPFNQKKCVPPDAVILTSPEERWWRSDSPRLPGDDFADVPPAKQLEASPALLHLCTPMWRSDPSLSATSGSKGHGLRAGPILFQTTSQTGCGTAAHFKMEEGVPPVISGGHFPGKQGANIIGATFDKSYTESLSHTISLGK